VAAFKAPSPLGKMDVFDSRDIESCDVSFYDFSAATTLGGFRIANNKIEKAHLTSIESDRVKGKN